MLSKQCLTTLANHNYAIRLTIIAVQIIPQQAIFLGNLASTMVRYAERAASHPINAFLRRLPQRYSPSSPSLRITRWQGIR